MVERKTRKDGSKSLRIQLNPEMTEIFYKIVEERKFQTDAEAIRYCIVETHKKAEFHLEEGYWKKIKDLLKYDYVHHKERIYSIKDFVNKAIDHYIEEIDRQNQSILSFDVRQNLQDDELDLSMAFIECQEESPGDHVTAEKLASKMGKRNIGEVQNLLDNFVERGIIQRLIHNGTYYYNAKKVSSY